MEKETDKRDKTLSPMDSKAIKRHSTPRTLKWLHENYRLSEGICIPRSALYIHYLDFCRRSAIVPVNAAGFGKVIRQQFPQITTRRLGTRGQSKYHYYGIAVRESSMYYESTLSKKENSGPLQEPIKKGSCRHPTIYSHRTKLGSLLPEFPDVDGLNFTHNVSKDLVSSFLVMYRTHCQRILDTVIRASFDEVQHYLIHFWHGMPAHVQPIFGSDRVARLVGICDSQLYKALSSVLMPSLLQPLPESLSHVIRWFSKELQTWLERALHGLPSSLQEVKLEEAVHFAFLMEKQLSLNHLSQAARTVTQSSDIILQMSDDWSFLDLDSVCRQTVSVTCATDASLQFYNLLNACEDFEKILEDDVTLERFTDWLDKLTNTYIVEPSNNLPHRVGKMTRMFLLTWSTFTAKVIRDLTIGSAPSFGSFHILELMLEQYLLYKTDLIMTEAKMNATLAVLRGDSQDELLKEFERPLRRRYAEPQQSTNHHVPKSSWGTSSNEIPRYAQGPTDAASFNAHPDWTEMQNDVTSHHSQYTTWPSENPSFTQAQFPQ